MTTCHCYLLVLPHGIISPHSLTHIYTHISITAKTSFEAMKKMGKFNYLLWGNKEYLGGNGVFMEEGKLFNKGKGT